MKIYFGCVALTLLLTACGTPAVTSYLLSPAEIPADSSPAPTQPSPSPEASAQQTTSAANGEIPPPATAP